MQPKVLKYILDIESIVSEIEEIKLRINNNFDAYKADFVVQRAIERDLEIIGEAVKKLLELDNSIEISFSKRIIGLRNIISHAYDTVEPELIWGIIQKDIPVLYQEIQAIKNG